MSDFNGITILGQSRSSSRRRTPSLLTHLPPDAAHTGNLTYTPPATHEEMVRYLRSVDDDRLHILIDHSSHYDSEAIEAGIDLDSDWLLGERQWADAARDVLADRTRRGYRFEPGRMLVSHELLDEIRQRLDLVALIGQRVQLRRMGRAHVGRCPWHESKSGTTLNVYPDGRYWCYGCHAYGDGVEWLRATESLSFREAAKRAVVLAGMVQT